MKITRTRERLLASSMICGVALVGLSATQAAAQQAAPAPATGGAEVSEIVVTGSRIPQPNLTSASPITVVGAQDVKLQGVTRTEDLINSLPQVMASQGGGVSNGSQGIATLDLRGLGPARTLVLVNGRRVAPGDPANPVTDLNFIPAPLIERVDVLSGGASAVYGSDAISGVVNFIMLKNFEGVRLDAQVGEYQHDNSNSGIQAVNTAKGFTAPNGNVWDGRQTQITAVLGINSSDGKGNATVYAGYRNIQAVLQAARDYSYCALGESGSKYVCRGSGTTPQSHIFSNDLAALSLPYEFTVDKAGPGNTVKAGSDTYNFAPINYYQRPDEQYLAGAFAHYEVNPHLDLYSEFMFMDDHTVAQIAPSGIFGQTFNIACNSPLLSAQEVTTFCTNAGIPATGTASLSILRRNVEGGNRQDNLRHTDYRFVIGGKGDINDDWSYDVYAQLGRTVYQEEYLNDVSLRRTANALNVVNGPNGLVCADATAVNEGCVPWQIFTVTGATPGAVSYVSTPGFKEGSTTEMIVDASVTGKLGFLKSPWATDPVGVAGGAEYRRENLELRVDSEFQTGDLAGQGGPTPPVSGTYDVYELFGEARVPVMQDMPFAKDLSLDLGYRFSDYSSAGTTDTYKIEGDWKPIDDIRFRASYERAVRAPNVVELFTPQALGLSLSGDPCAGPNPTATQAQCLNTGLTAQQYGHIPANPAAQYNGLTGGNPNLAPEKADTYSAGFVLTPSFLPGFSLTVDYFNIKVNSYIQALDPNLTLASCLQQGGALCALVHRNPSNGSLWLGNPGNLAQDGYVVGTNVNVGFLQTKGWDIEATYRSDLDRFGLNNAGRLGINFNGTILSNFITDPGIPTHDANGHVVTQYDCAGLYGVTTCAQPRPKWKHRMRLTWTTPWTGLELSGAWRYIGEVSDQHTSSNPFLKGKVNPVDSKISAQNYFDLTAQYRLRDRYTFRIGVNNVFDKEPPLVGSTAGGNSIYFNGNTYPTVYDALGRFAFIGLTADF